MGFFKNANHESRTISKAEKALNKCIEIIYGPDDTKRTVELLLEQVCQFYDGKRCYLFRRDVKQRTFSEEYEWCEPGVSSQLNSLQGLPDIVFKPFSNYIEKPRPLFIESYNNTLNPRDLLLQIAIASNVESAMISPLVEKGNLVGFIGVDDPRKNVGSFFLINSVAAFVYSEIQRSIHLELLNRLSYSDELTNVGNRHAFYHMLEEVREKDMTIGIAFVDVNNLKKINDQQGHKAGDKLLISVCNELQKYFHGFVYRVGGDEFIIFQPDVDEVVFVERIEKIKSFWTEEISSSMGWIWSPKADDIEALLNIADRRMYEEKEKFRLSHADKY